MKKTFKLYAVVALLGLFSVYNATYSQVIVDTDLLLSPDFQTTTCSYWESCYSNPDSSINYQTPFIYTTTEQDYLIQLLPTQLFRGLFQNDSEIGFKAYNRAETILFSKENDLDNWVLEAFRPESYIFAQKAVETLRLFFLHKSWNSPDWERMEQKLAQIEEDFNINYNLKTVEEVLDQYHRLKAEGFENIIENFGISED